MPVVTVSEQHAQEYDAWFDAHESLYQAEVGELRKSIPGEGLA